MKTSEDIQELERCKALSVLDISYNSLEEPDVLEVLAMMLMMTLIMMMIDVLKVLATMPELHVLTSTGNPIIRKTRDYRRNVLHK